MVKAPSQSPDQKPHKQVLVSNHQILHHHHHNHLHQNQHHNSKKYRRDQLMANESPGNGAGMPIEASTSGGTLVVTSIPVTVPPMVAVVAPTTRATVNAINGSQAQQQQHISNSSSPVKVSANVMHQQQQQQQSGHARTQHLHTTTPHVSHVYHQFALPMQIPATFATAATATTTQAAAWPLTEPAFHFGPGFEPRQIGQQHGTSNTSQTSNSEHVVFFHVSPGVSVTFQVAGNREVVRGKCKIFELILISFLFVTGPSSFRSPHRAWASISGLDLRIELGPPYWVLISSTDLNSLIGVCTFIELAVLLVSGVNHFINLGPSHRAWDPAYRLLSPHRILIPSLNLDYLILVYTFVELALMLVSGVNHFIGFEPPHRA